jgi:hypothetical protein
MPKGYRVIEVRQLKKSRIIDMDRHFYLSLESHIEEQRDKPLVDVICSFLEDCAARYLVESRVRAGAAERDRPSSEKELLINDFQRRMSRWQHAVRAYFERAVVDADLAEKETGRHGRTVGEMEKALGWIDSNGDSFAEALVISSIVQLEEPPCP